MPGHTMTAQAQADNSLQTAADSVGSVVEAVKQGALDAQARVSEAAPAVGQFLGRMIYSSCYAVSYGIVFPVMLVVRVVPKDNVVVHGLVDGALAARDRVAGWNEKSAAADDSSSENHEPAVVENGHPARATSHRRRGTKRRGTRQSTRSPKKS